tara:strand:- start:1098 stop:1475 length:378 start_codon:yes stop_codon:yes gene_type:complete
MNNDDNEDNGNYNPNMVFQHGGKDLYGGGFKINHRIYDNNNTKININDNYKDIFKNLVIPFGLYFDNTEHETLNIHKYQLKEDTIKDDVFNNLLKLVNHNERKNYDIRTRKNKKTMRKTRKASKK